MSLPRLLKRPSSAIFASSRAHHPHDTLFLTSLPATGATRHVRWASIVPYTIHNPNPPPPPLTPEQVLAQLQQQEPQYGVPLDPFQPFGQQQSPQQPHPLTQEQLEQRLEHQQRLRQQEELQLQLQRHRNALQQQQLKRQIEQELELELEQGQEQDHIKGGNAEMRGKIAASTTSEEAAARCHPKEETREDNNHHKNGQDLQQTSSEHRPTDHHHHSAPAATTTTEEEQQQRLLELRKQRRSTFGYYFQLHPTRQQQHGLQQPQQAQPVRDLVQEAVTRTLSISTILPKRVSKISFEDRVQLAMLDYTGTQIDAMAPERAAEILLQAKASPKTSQQDSSLSSLSATEKTARPPHPQVAGNHKSAIHDASLRGGNTVATDASSSSLSSLSSLSSPSSSPPSSSLASGCEKARRVRSREMARREHHHPALRSEDSDTRQYEIHAPPPSLHDQRSPMEPSHCHMSSTSSSPSSASPKPAGTKTSAISLNLSSTSSSSF